MCLGASLTFDGDGRALGGGPGAEEMGSLLEEEDKNGNGKLGGGDGGGSRVWYLNGQDRLWEWRVVD